MSLLDMGEAPLNLNNRNPMVTPREHVINNGKAKDIRVPGAFKQDEGIAQEEAIAYCDLPSFFKNNAGVIHIATKHPILRSPFSDHNTNTAPSGGLVVAMHSRYDVRLPANFNSRLRREDDDIRNGIIVGVQKDGCAREAPFTGVCSGCDVLAEKGVVDEGFMATVNRDACGREVGDVAISYDGANGTEKKDASRGKVSIKGQALQQNVFKSRMAMIVS